MGGDGRGGVAVSVATYPVRVDATLDPALSRWLWLVKWLLAIPHYFVLFFLWVAFVAVSVFAFFAILLTGRYPPGLFEFNVGVLRWSWRVAFYTYGTLGTDRYPPFTLAEVPDYPAHLDIAYPAHLSRGLVLVKWWLLAIPHYLVVGIFVGGGTWALWQTTDTHTSGAPGLIGLLVLIAAVVLLFTGRYPQQLFDFVLGMNRWVLRVAAYAGMMTDEYPPFRLDLGGHEPFGGTMRVPPPTTTPPAPPSERRGWTTARVVALLIASVLGLVSLGFLGAGGVAMWATNTQRDPAGYLTTGTRTFATSSYAVTSDAIDLGSPSNWVTPRGILGTMRIRATSSDPAKSVFVGVAPKAAVETYLAGVEHLVVTNWASGDPRSEVISGAAPATSPADAGIWSAQVSGPSTQTLTWRPTSGQWVVVVMNPSARAGVSVTADVGATVPDLGWMAVGLLAAGAILLIVAIVLIAVPVTRAGR
jgi:hypothetical protein